MARKNTAPNTTNETADQTAATVTVGCNWQHKVRFGIGQYTD